MSMFSLQIEKHVLGGLLKNPELLADIEPFVSDKDFYNNAHVSIFKIIKNSILSQQNVDSVLVAQKIKDCGAENSFKESFGNEVSVFDYIDNLSYVQISKKGVVEAARKLVDLRIKRELIDSTTELQKIIKSGESATEIIGKCDVAWNGQITSYSTLDDKPTELFEDLFQEISDTKEVESSGFLTPYSEFNRLYGGFRPGNVYCFAARPGQGKTTFLNNIVFRTALKQGKSVPILFIDTEMDKRDIRKRMLSALSGVSLHLIETGKFKKNKEAYEKVSTAAKQLENVKFPCKHYQAGSVTIDQIVSKIRRWMLSDVGRGNPAIIAYDYLKLTGEKVGQNWAEYQVMGEKVGMLHQLSLELNVPIVTAVQLNRTAENFNRRGSQASNDSAAMAISDRIQWFCSFTAGFTRKTVEEMALDEGLVVDEAQNMTDMGQLDQLRFGTHKMTVYKSRVQGEDAAGHHDLVRRALPDGSVRYENNYLNFDISNFGVEERGSLASIVDAQREFHNLDDANTQDGEIL